MSTGAGERSRGGNAQLPSSGPARRAGLFLVFEGVEGSGKTTQAALLADWLSARGIPHVLTREPGGTAVGEEIRRLVLHQRHEVPARTELMLVLAARAAFVHEIVRPALQRGEVVVADRYELSTLAYQGYGRGLPLDEVRATNAVATGGLRPDLTLVLDVSAADGAARRHAAGLERDRIEGAGAAFHAQVAEAYHLLAGSEAGVERVAGGGAVAVVRAEVMRLLGAHFPETFAGSGVIDQTAAGDFMQRRLEDG